MATKPNYTIVATAAIAGFGSVSIVQDNDAERVFQHVKFNDVVVPAKGKTPAGNYSSSVSELLKLTEFIPELKSESVVKTMKRNLVLASHLFEQSNEPSFLVSACEELNVFCAANQPDKPGAVRNVDTWTVKVLADMFLVLAGTSGELPEVNMVIGKIQEAIDAAKTAAETKAEKLGKDDNGQYRLKAERTAKDETTE